MKAKRLPSVERLRELFDYDAETGILTRRRVVGVGRKRCLHGKPAGYKRKRGYVVVSADGESYLAHRVIWKMVHGTEPSPTLDHRHGAEAGNRPGNLREATNAQNVANSPHPRKHLLPRGVHLVSRPSPNPYRAQIVKDGKPIHLGVFADPEEAHRAYVAASIRLYGEYAFVARGEAA